MRILDRADALKLWSQYWQDMKKEWFKIEVLQDYTGEDDCDSLRAWLDGDRQNSLKLLPNDTHAWAEQLQRKNDQGVLMRRVRVLEKPYTPYTEWEFECYKHNNLPSGERVLVVDKQKVKDLGLPKGDLMMFDNQRIAVCEYDATGKMIRQTFYDEHDDISGFLQLKHDLLTLARPFRDRL